MLRDILIIIFIATLFQTAIILPSLRSPDKSLQFVGDSRVYATSALNLIKHGVYSDNPSLKPAHFKPPGYPLFLAGLFTFVGFNLRLAILTHILLIVVGACLIYKITILVASRRIAFISGLIASVSPNVAFHAGWILSEPLFVDLLLIGLLFFLLYLHNMRVGFAVVCGIFLGLATLVRAVGLFVPMLLVLYSLVVKRLTRLNIIGSAVMVAIFSIVLAPWCVRNLLVFNRLFIGTTGEYTAFIWATRTYAAANKMSEERANTLLESVVEREAKKTSMEKQNDAQLEGLRLKVAINTVASYPLTYLKLWVLSSLRVAFQPMNFSEIIAYYSKDSASAWQNLKPLPPLQGLGPVGWVGAVYRNRIRLIPLFGYLIFFGEVLYLVALYLGIAKCVLTKPKPLEGWLLPLLISSYIVLMSGAHPEARFRVSAEPLMAIVAGMGLTQFRGVLKGCWKHQDTGEVSE